MDTLSRFTAILISRISASVSKYLFTLVYKYKKYNTSLVMLIERTCIFSAYEVSEIDLGLKPVSYEVSIM